MKRVSKVERREAKEKIIKTVDCVKGQQSFGGSREAGRACC